MISLEDGTDLFREEDILRHIMNHPNAHHHGTHEEFLRCCLISLYLTHKEGEKKYAGLSLSVTAVNAHFYYVGRSGAMCHPLWSAEHCICCSVRNTISPKIS